MRLKWKCTRWTTLCPPSTDLCSSITDEDSSWFLSSSLVWQNKKHIFPSTSCKRFPSYIPHLWLFSLLGACCDHKMLFVLSFIHCLLQMCFLVFVNESFSFSRSAESLQIIRVYIPAQNRVKMQIASRACKTIWCIFIKASKLEFQPFSSQPKFVTQQSRKRPLSCPCSLLRALFNREH